MTIFYQGRYSRQAKDADPIPTLKTVDGAPSTGIGPGHYGAGLSGVDEFFGKCAFEADFIAPSDG